MYICLLTYQSSIECEGLVSLTNKSPYWSSSAPTLICHFDVIVRPYFMFRLVFAIRVPKTW